MRLRAARPLFGYLASVIRRRPDLAASPSAPWFAACLLAVLLAPACAGTPRVRVLGAIDARAATKALAAYEVFRREEEPDGALLARIAALMLEQAALGDDARLRDAALGQLALAGTAGEDSLRSIAASRGHDVARAKALATLAGRGDDGSRDTLRTMFGSEDPDVHAAAVRVLDVHDRADALRDALASPHATVRAAAAEALRAAAPDAAIRRALAEVARVDPEPRVRAAAVRALGKFGSSAVDTLRERLSDADAGVRTAAVASLVAADRTAARLTLAPLLALPPSGAGIETARFLALGGEGDLRATVDARAYLLRTLETGDATLRVSAALALLSLPGDPTIAATLAQRMKDDTEPSVRLLLASTLLRPGDAAETRATAARALQVLAALLAAGGMVGIQAAVTLASSGDAAAIRALREGLSNVDVAIRRTAARGLAREALLPDAARRALRDADAGVRIAAAGGILAAHAVN